jgi:YfiH family protein
MTLPTVPDTFRWTREPWGAALRCVPLETVAEHLFSTRQLALTADVGERQLARAVGAARLLMTTQVHGASVVVASPETLPARTTPGDALVSRHGDVAVAVRAADCVPLLLADRATGAVAAVHAGWRGTAAGVATAAVRALRETFGTRPSDLVAAIGPSIGRCCYEVGSELVDSFAAAGHGRDLIARWFVARPPPRGSGGHASLHLDLAGANRDQLVLAGVPEEQIHPSGLCTAMHLDVLTSFRAERAQAGRIAAAIRSRG